MYVYMNMYSTCAPSLLHCCSEDQVPLLRSEYSGGAPVIVRPKDKLREEIKAAKRRKREEKLRFKEEKSRSKDESIDPRKLTAKLEKLQLKKAHSGRTEKTELVMAPVVFEGSKPEPRDHTQKTKKYVVHVGTNKQTINMHMFFLHVCLHSYMLHVLVKVCMCIWMHALRLDAQLHMLTCAQSYADNICSSSHVCNQGYTHTCTPCVCVLACACTCLH